MRAVHDRAHRWVVPIALVLSALWAGSAAAATTHFASPNGATTPSACTDVASPCSLPVALANTQAADTISLAAGTYDVQTLALPQVPLRWVATDGTTRPVLTSGGLSATVFLTGAQSGSTFEGLNSTTPPRQGPRWGPTTAWTRPYARRCSRVPIASRSPTATRCPVS